MDNLGIHKTQAIRQAIRTGRAHLPFLPPHSPNLNLTEQVFAKLKHLMRDTAERTMDATWRRIRKLLDRFTPKECLNYLVNAGYGST